MADAMTEGLEPALQLELVEGAREVTSLFEGLEAQPYHYTFNQSGAAFLGVCASICAAIAVGLFAFYERYDTPAMLSAGAFAVAAAAIVANVWRWRRFAADHFVALGDDKLYVGQRSRVWGIAWDLLDVEALGFKRMELSATKGTLPMRVGGQHIELHLYNALVHLKEDDMRGLMAELLQRCGADDDLSAALAGEE